MFTKTILVAISFAGTCLALPTIDARALNSSDHHWVDTWTSMPQLVEPDNLPPPPYKGSNAIFSDATLRQTLHVSIAVSTIRIQLSNTFGTTDLPITAASLALPINNKAGSNGIQVATLKELTFADSVSVTISKGKVIYSDPIDFKVDAMSMLTLSLYLQRGQQGTSITGHPGSRSTSWMGSGNLVNNETITGASTKHWYFATAVEAWAPKRTSAFIILGDSITDGRGSDDDMNNRWPDLLLTRMQRSGFTNISVNNQAAGGNRMLADGLGPSLLSRYTRDAITQPGVRYVLLFIGVNDIGSAGTVSATQTQIGNNLIAAFTKIAADCKKNNIAVFGATITPFSGSGQTYSNPTRETTRKRVNEWILSGGTFDAVVDFAKVMGDPVDGSKLASKYDGGDHLHPNEVGYQAMADAFSTDVFARFGDVV